MMGLNTTYAQIEKGNFLIGGGVGFEMDLVEDGDNPFTIFLTPNVLNLINDNLAVGGALGVVHTKAGDFSNTSLGILPSARYYLSGLESNMAFYVDAKAGLQINRVSFDGDADSESALTFSFGPGVAYFISDDVSIDTGLNFNRIGGDFDQSSINLNIGLQVFFTGKE